MFRKLLITGLASLALILPLTLTTTALACGPYGAHLFRPHKVYFRDYGADRWTLKGSFRTSLDALQAQEELRAQGLDVKYVRV